MRLQGLSDHKPRQEPGRGKKLNNEPFRSRGSCRQNPENRAFAREVTCKLNFAERDDIFQGVEEGMAWAGPCG